MHAEKVYIPETIENIISLSDYSLQHDETSLLNIGLIGLGMKPRTSTIQLQIQMEKLYMSILDITTVNNEHFKTKLKHFGIKHQPADHCDLLTREQKSVLRKLRLNNSIFIQCPNNGGGVVVMSKLDYNNKLLDLVNDVSKFKSIIIQ